MGNVVPPRRVRLGLLSEDEVAARGKRSVEEFVRVAKEGDLERVNAALSEGIHPNSKTVRISPRPRARRGAPATDAPPGAQKTGLSPLVVAAQAGHDHIIRNVLRAPIPDVDIDVTDLSGWTPLHYAVKTSRMSTIRILVQNGANLRARAVRCRCRRRRRPPAPAPRAAVVPSHQRPAPPATWRYSADGGL